MCVSRTLAAGRCTHSSGIRSLRLAFARIPCPLMGSLLSAPDEKLRPKSVADTPTAGYETNGTYGWKKVSVILPHDVSACWFPFPLALSGVV